MKAFFRSLTLPAKLILLGTIPLVFLLLIAFRYNKERRDKMTMLDGYIQRIDQSISINQLIDHIQLERRYSFGYTLKGAWQNEMLQQRTRVDTELEKVVREHGEALPGFTSYTFLTQLKTFRTRLDNKELQPMDVMNYYTNVIFRLGSLNNVAAGDVVYLQPVMRTIFGQKILADIITYNGIARAQVYLMLETGRHDPQIIASVNQLREIIGSYEKEFAIRSSPESVNAYNALKNDPDVKITDSVYNHLFSHNTPDTAISADFWWNTSASAVDKAKTLQRNMMQQGQRAALAIYDHEKWLQTWAIIFLFVILAIVISFIIFTIRIITKSLGELRTAAEELSVGKTGIHITPESDDAIGALAQSILAIDRNNQQLSGAARAIGEGDFSVAVRPRSREDILGNAIVQMRNDLQAFARENEEKMWVQTGIAQINDSLRGDKKVVILCQDTLYTLVRYLGCETGLFYTAEDRTLELQAGYAVPNNDMVPKKLEFGETLIGQAAKQREMLQLKDVPDAFLQIRSGLGSAQPAQVIAIPLLVYDIVQGVIEIATLRPLEEYKIAFIKEVASDIAIALQTAKSKLRLQELFNQTQAQAEELQSQHTELENINAELEAQTEKLQASEEELRVQQEELLQANQELEERSRLLEERNQVIVERNLEIQQKAEELALSTKYKSEFLANMSHELRTPLNSILLLSRLLSENNERNLSGEQVEYATVIQSSGQGLLSLIDEILDLSKIEAGKMELEYGQVMVQEIVGDMKALFGPVAREKKIELEVIVDQKVPSLIETDKLRLEQVLRNLLSNAIKFTSRGSVRLTVDTLKDNEAFLCFSVKDTGIGIPAEKQALIFEAFQQADGSTRRKYGGTGLGLSISRELVRLLGGEIKVASEPGRGSEFTIYVPRDKKVAALESERLEPADSTLPSADPDKDAEEKPAPPKNLRAEKIPESLPDDRREVKEEDKTILIIEDDTAFAKALLDFTHKRGYKGLVAVRGDEGIALAQQYRPVGILLDIQLPVKDGWEVMEELKANPATRHIPVHIMSSLEAKRESIMKGAVDFINKPLAFEQMQEVFKKIEHVITKEQKKVLIVEENPKHAKALAYFLETFNVNAKIAGSVTGSVDELQKEDVDCVILDMGIPDQHAYEMLEGVKHNPGMEKLPIIIFTGKSLSKTEEARIKQYADSIVVKTAHSYQRILDEVSLFLHLVEENKKGDRPSRYKRLGALNEVLAGKKVLVADDDVRNIFSLTRALEIHNMEVITAVDGKEALKRLEEHPDTAVVLMDIMMPEMDGYEAMQEIRKRRAFKNLPIIAVTAKAMTGDREKCIKAGASDYISKPVDIDQLLSLLRVWLYDKSI